jgi:hypothetical protein
MQLWVVVGLRCKVSGAFRRQRNRGEDSGASDSHVSQPALSQGSQSLFPAGCPTAFYLHRQTFPTTNILFGTAITFASSAQDVILCAYA